MLDAPIASLRRLTIGALALLCCTVAPAQVPDGWYVASSMYFPPFAPGPGGIQLMHPRSGAWHPVTGLPPRLVNATTSGINDAVFHSPTGAILAGEFSFPGAGTANLHVIHLAGTALDPTASFAISLGAVQSPGSGIDQMQVMPDGRVLILARNLAGGPLANHRLGIVDLGPRSVSAIPTSNKPPGLPLAMAYDAATQRVFVAFVQVATVTTNIASVSVFGGSFSLLTTISGGVNAMHMEHGLIVVDAFGSSQTELKWVDPVTGTVVRSMIIPHSHHGFVPEPVTGGYAVVGRTNLGPPADMYYVDSAGTATLIASPPPGGWGLLNSIHWSPNPFAFGLPSPNGAPEYRWQLHPNPGGLPLVDNASFAVQIENATGATFDPGWWYWSCWDPRTTPWQPVPGLACYLAPGTIVPGAFLDPNAPNPGRIDLPIPNSLGLVGLSFHLQTLHANATLSASEGLTFTVL